jgi:hypothetical protein
MFRLPSLGAPVARRISGLIAIILAVSAAPALAETPIGEISGEIGDEAFVWETLDVPSEGTATAAFSEFGPVTTVSIQGHEQGGESRMRNVVSLDFSLMGNDVMDIDVGFFPNGLSAPFYVSDDAPRGAEISFDTLDLDDDAARAEGSFTALLCRKDGMMSPPDTDNCIEARGTFVTQLRPGL